MKEVRQQKLQVYGFISITFWKRQNCRNRNNIKRKWRTELAPKEYERTFQDGGNIPCLDTVSGGGGLYN